MNTFSDWVGQFIDEIGFLGTLAFDVQDDLTFPNESNSFEEIESYIKSNWNADENYLRKLKNAFTNYEKEDVFLP